MNVTLTPEYQALSKRIRANKREMNKIRAALAGRMPDADTGERIYHLMMEHTALVKEQSAMILAEPIPVSFADGIYGKFLTDAERERIRAGSGESDGD